ncbi:MAG: flagellar hook-basal body complex protein [Lacunisphaera sp.]
MPVDATSSANSAANVAAYSTTNTRKPKQTLGSDDFMKLLAVQFQSQDPMKPMEDTAFIAQMAQFSSLEQSNSMVKEMGLLRSDQQNLAANSMLGRTVTRRRQGRQSRHRPGLGHPEHRRRPGPRDRRQHLLPFHRHPRRKYRPGSAAPGRLTNVRLSTLDSQLSTSQTTMSLIGTLTSGVSALRTFSKGLEVIGNNIANINTTGYKSSQATFADSFSNTLRASAPSSGATSSQSAVQVGTGVQLASIQTNFNQGSLNSTGNVTDLGISGKGFFIVQNATSGMQYATRDGQFRPDDNGYLITTGGLRLQGMMGTTVGDMQIGASVPTGAELQSVSFDTAGNMIESYSDGTSATTGRVQLQNFNDPSALMREGSNLYSGLTSAGPIGGGILAGSNDPGASGLGLIQSGTLESSNVDLTDQFSQLITTQRSFQAGSRLITVSDSILEDIVNLKRS